MLVVVLVGLPMALAGLLVAGAGEAHAGPAAPVVVCAVGDASCDVDGDRIPDDVEVAVCGSATCATGTEDADRDGLSDWVEFQATGSVVGADPAADADGDRIPDFAELIVCGTTSCATGDEDADGDGAPDWTEAVICGDVTCATGSEDYDGDGIADAARLAAHPPAQAKRADGAGPLAFTGAHVAVLAAVGVVLVAVGAGLTARWRTRGGNAADSATGAGR